MSTNGVVTLDPCGLFGGSSIVTLFTWLSHCRSYKYIRNLWAAFNKDLLNENHGECWVGGVAGK